TLSRRRDLKERLGPRNARRRFESPGSRHDRSKSPKEKGPERRTMFKRLEKGVFHRLRDKEKECVRSFGDIQGTCHIIRSREIRKQLPKFSTPGKQTIDSEKHHRKRASSQRTEALSESEGSAG
ncbi:hypothetical protein Tco_0745786, partial [Tanacetum coccineum]